MSFSSCVAMVDERPVYKVAEVMQIQVWTREWETLGVGEGQTVAVKVPHLPEARYLIASVVAVTDTGNSWVHFICPIEMRRTVTKIVPTVRLRKGR